MLSQRLRFLAYNTDSFQSKNNYILVLWKISYVMCVYLFRGRFRIGPLLKMAFLFFFVGKFVTGWGPEFEIDRLWFVCKTKGKECIPKYLI